jgi:cytochrome c556
LKKITRTLIIGAVLVAGAAFAKEGVQDPTVKARMELMDGNAAAAKVLGGMAAGKTAFDAKAAEEAKLALATNAAGIAAAFKDPATDPVSVASPDIWTNWDDFVAKAEALQKAAEGMDTASLEGVQAGMGAVGETCKGCHSVYQIKQ